MTSFEHHAGSIYCDGIALSAENSYRTATAQFCFSGRFVLAISIFCVLWLLSTLVATVLGRVDVGICIFWTTFHFPAPVVFDSLRTVLLFVKRLCLSICPCLYSTCSFACSFSRRRNVSANSSLPAHTHRLSHHGAALRVSWKLAVMQAALPVLG